MPVGGEKPDPQGNSRTSKLAAGWRGPHKGTYDADWERLLASRVRTKWGNFSWVSPAPLLASINDKIAKGLDDLVNQRRPRWVAEMRRGDWSDERLLVSEHAEKADASFIVLGDPGEQDASQYAVIKPMLRVAGDTDFMVIDSDVIYPAGDINDYLDGFYLPYRDYGSPIYGIPGNHDWYDGLNGFMFHFCGAEPLAPIAYRSGSYSWRERFAHLLWRKPSPPEIPRLMHERHRRCGTDEPWSPAQPGPYFAVETRDLLVVCIDTGITGKLDREQGDWLRRVSGDPRDKVLITGKPIWVDGTYDPGGIDWGSPGALDLADTETDQPTVDDIVRDPANRYVAAIGGDIHNYQRYPVTIRDGDGAGEGTGEPGRVIQYIVAGGGGAFLSATHRIPKIDLEPPHSGPIKEEDVRMFPLRGDSLARFVNRFVPMFAILISVAVTTVVTMLALYFFWLGGFSHQIGNAELDGVEAWKALLVVPGTLVAGLGAAGIGFAIAHLAAPFRYKTATTVMLGVAVSSMLVFITSIAAGTEWDWIWKLVLASLIALATPPVAFMIYYLGRDFIGPSVRTAIALSPAVAVAVVAAATSITIRAEGALIVAVSMLVSWVVINAVGLLTRPSARPQTHKIRLRSGKLIPPAIGVLGLVSLLGAGRTHSWLPAAVVWVNCGLAFAIALAMIGLGWRVFPAIPHLLKARAIDADQTSAWIARELNMVPERPSARALAIEPATEKLCALTVSTWPLSRVISEIAEAARPPFFKSFLRLDIENGVLRINAFGVSGHGEDEESPPLEDSVRILLRKGERTDRSAS